MQAAQMAAMQTMVQGMYLQAVANQGGTSPKAAMPPGPVMPQASSAPSKEFIGTLKSLSARHGYGFIDCQETKDLYGRDVHIAEELLPEGGKEVGTKLKFTVGLSSKVVTEKGGVQKNSTRPQA